MVFLNTEQEPLPPLYDGWVTELLQGNVPRESRATCNDCAMCSSPGARSGPRDHYYDPRTKCCTYIPVLHNFLVGRILSDKEPANRAGRVTVEKRIADGVAVTPLGLGAPPTFSVLYSNVSAEAFGRSQTLRCPHYLEDGGRCGVWRNRNSVCSTWFCKHVRGQVGYTFWRHSLLHLLRYVEQDLACWGVLQLDLGDEAFQHLMSTRDRDDGLTAESIDNRVETERHKRIWGEWCGREADFFVRCAELVERLSWSEVLAICGPQAHAYARLTKQAFAKLTSDAIPPVLTIGPMQIVQIQQEATRVSTYSSLDPVEVPNVVMALWQYFDGRPTDDAVDAIAAKTGIRLEPALIRKMVDFGILVPPDSDTLRSIVLANDSRPK
jgi:hypothetical protein